MRNSIDELEKQIKNIEYENSNLIITMMDNSKKVIEYSEEKLIELRSKMLSIYSKNKQRYLDDLEKLIEKMEKFKVLSFIAMIGSFILVYNIDADVKEKIIIGLMFACATILYHYKNDLLKEKYELLKSKVMNISYYIDNIDNFSNVSENGVTEYSINIDEVNYKGMTLKKLKSFENGKNML